MSAAAEKIFPDEASDTPQIDERMLKLTPGQINKEMDEIREERKKLSKRDSELYQLWRALEARLIQICDEQGMKRVSTDVEGATLTATITEEEVPVLEDFDDLWEYMKATDSPHLLQRRVAAGAFRELLAAGIQVPGLSPYKKRSISLRKTKR